jgi:hypothetical protein
LFFYHSYYHQAYAIKRYKRSRLDANRALHAEWEAQGPYLASAYLQWKYEGSTYHQNMAATDGSIDVPGSSIAHIFHVTVVDIKGMSLTICVIPL